MNIQTNKVLRQQLYTLDNLRKYGTLKKHMECLERVREEICPTLSDEQASLYAGMVEKLKESIENANLVAPEDVDGADSSERAKDGIAVQEMITRHFTEVAISLIDTIILFPFGMTDADKEEIAAMNAELGTYSMNLTEFHFSVVYTTPTSSSDYIYQLEEY